MLSTPTYTTHRDPRVWGSNALEFVPEKWEGEKKAELEKAFLGFSYGPRACIGRNVSTCHYRDLGDSRELILNV